MTHAAHEGSAMADGAPGPALKPLTLEGHLNQNCFCVEIDPARVWRALEQIAAGAGPSGVVPGTAPGSSPARRSSCRTPT